MSVGKSAMRCTETSQIVCRRKSDLVNFRVYSGNQLEGLTWPFLGRNCKVLGWFQALRGLNITSKRWKKNIPCYKPGLTWKVFSCSSVTLTGRFPTCCCCCACLAAWCCLWSEARVCVCAPWERVIVPPPAMSPSDCRACRGLWGGILLCGEWAGHSNPFPVVPVKRNNTS